MKKKNIENAIKRIEELMQESQQNSTNAACGYDEGYYNGEVDAYFTALNILKEAIQ